jgi:hypothetical protein
LEHVFAELASDILRRISNGEAPGSSVETTIADFRSLLSNSNDDNVTDQALLGLIGELLVLRKLAGYSPSAVDGWTGPLDQRHDFRRGTFAIEVKTSSRSDARRVTISSIDQLEEPADGTLVLIHVLVEPAAGGSVSVASLFSSLVALGASTHELRERLAKMGCSDPNAATWNRTSFELQGLTGYSVIDGFPRITRSQFKAGQIPSGVSAITYTIELGSLGDFILDPHTFEVELQRVAK